MNFNPLVSIVIPVYNGSDYMKEAIDSALNQTYNNCEVIVVNDGSDDEGKTDVIAKSYGDKIRYFFKENGGVSSALNLGIQKMNGEYFSWLSHDDAYYPNKVEEQISYFKKKDKAILYGSYDIINEKSEIVENRKQKYISPEKFRLFLLINYPVNGITVLIPKKCFNVVGYFNEELKTTQDYDIWFRLSKKFVFIQQNIVLAKSRKHSAQGSKKISGFLEEAIATKIFHFNKYSNDELLKLTNENNILMVYSKLAINYIIRGSENAGLPANFMINLIKVNIQNNGAKIHIKYYLIFFFCYLLKLSLFRKIGKRYIKKIPYFNLNKEI
jgi:glycosyltransferase involved in cell wall biosynthesis